MKKILLMKSVLLCLLVSQAWAQDRVIAGKVTSAEDGAALPGVNISVKGTAIGTATGADGMYKLNASSGATLVFSFIGLFTQEIALGNQTVIDVKMVSDVKALSEVVVTGVGVATDKRRLGIAVEAITSDKLPTIPTASIDQALVGKIAGAQISSSSGSPGSPVSIQLRGVNTLGAGTNPLIMVDGVEMSSTSLNSLDLSNVERVEVVQGAAAATIYGAQGANGVIQVFTKKGKEGPIRIEASARVSFDQALNIGNLHQPMNHSFTTDANGNILDNAGGLLKQNDLGLWGEPTWENGPTAQNNKPYQNNTKYYNHIDQLFRTAKTQNYSVSASGGTGKTDYSFSASHNSQESILIGKLDRTNFTVNIGTELFKNFRFRFTNQFVYSDNSVPNGSSNTTGNNNGSSSAIGSAMYTYPFADFTYRDADGNHTYKFGGAGANSTNPLYAYQYQNYSNKTLDILPSINLNYKINKYLELDYKYGLNHSRIDFQRFSHNQEGNRSSAANGYFVGAGIKGDIVQAQTRKTNQNSLVTATIRTDWLNDFGWNIPISTTTQVAFDWRKYQFNRNYSNFIGLPRYEPINGAQASVNNGGEYEDKFITYGFLVNQKFEYGDIAGVSGGFRADYSSVFNEGNSPFFFPRGDAYLRLSKLGFWNALQNFLPEFKLRAAYGEAGIQPATYNYIPNLSNSAGPVPNHYLRINTLGNGSFDNGSYLSVNPNVSNPALKVENSKELEYGVDLGLAPLKGNWLSYFALNFTVWDRKGSNVIWQQPLAASSGAQTLYTNYLKLASNGIQFSLDTKVYETPDFGWDLLTIFGHQRSKVISTTDGKDIPLVWTSAATYTLQPGQLIGAIYGYKAITSFDMTNPSGVRYIAEADAGNYEIVNGRVVEKATKKVQFTSDKYLLGNTTPDFNMSFTNSFHYKNFLNFSFQLDWVSGAKTYNQTKEWMYSEGLHGDFDKPVTINGQAGNWTAYYKSFYDAVESNGTKDFFLENSSFVRLRNVSVAVDLAKLFRLPKVNRLQLVFTGRNLATWTKYTGFDPEANLNTSGGGSGSAATQVSAQRGLDFFSFPNFRSYQVGLNVGF